MLGASILQAQTPQQWIKHAETATQERDYYGAAVYYKEALKVDQNNVEAWFQYALSLKKVHNCAEAEKAFQEVFDRYQESKYEVAQYWLGEMQKCQGKYDLALVNFRDYVGNARVRAIYEYGKAKQEVISTKYAIKHLADSGKYEALPLEGEVNSPLAEFSPNLFSDSLMSFSSLQYFKKKTDLQVDKKEKGGLARLYTSSIEKGKWINIEELELEGIDPSYHIANACAGPDGDLFLSACSPEGICKIYRAKKSGKTYEEALPLGEMINDPASSQTQPFVIEISGKIHLFFASNQARGRGQYDIWYSKYDKGRKAFARPRNMGRAINTAGNELSPYWDQEDGRIYFSSDWHNGFGGFDIHYAEGVPNSLKPVQNAGLGINSSGNDLYFTRSTESRNMYLASNREGGEALKGTHCCNDIYKVNVLKQDTVVKKDSLPLIALVDTVKIDLEDTVMTEQELEEEFKEIQTYLPLALYFHNDEPNPRTLDTNTNLRYDETFESYFNLLGRYKKQYRSLFVGASADTAEVQIQDFFESKVKAGKETMDKALAALLHQLKNGKKLELSIKGFASPLARSDYNLNLTKRRIASFKIYIDYYQNGVFHEYLTAGDLKIIEKAFGESKSDSVVSDQLSQAAKSIYSIGAAKERRIEILSIELK